MFHFVLTHYIHFLKKWESVKRRVIKHNSQSSFIQWVEVWGGVKVIFWNNVVRDFEFWQKCNMSQCVAYTPRYVNVTVDGRRAVLWYRWSVRTFWQTDRPTHEGFWLWLWYYCWLVGSRNVHQPFFSLSLSLSSLSQSDPSRSVMCVESYVVLGGCMHACPSGRATES